MADVGGPVRLACSRNLRLRTKRPDHARNSAPVPKDRSWPLYSIEGQGRSRRGWGPLNSANWPMAIGRLFRPLSEDGLNADARSVRCIRRCQSTRMMMGPAGRDVIAHHCIVGCSLVRPVRSCSRNAHSAGRPARSRLGQLRCSASTAEAFTGTALHRSPGRQSAGRDAPSPGARWYRAGRRKHQAKDRFIAVERVTVSPFSRNFAVTVADRPDA